MFKMWSELECMWAIYLGILAIGDVRNRTISWLGIVAGFFMLVGSQWFLSEAYEQRVLGVLLGMLFLVISKVTKESIGYGDSWIFLILGGVMGIWKLLICLIIAFLTCFVYGIGIIAIKKCRMKEEVPFLPFLFLAYFITIMCG